MSKLFLCCCFLFLAAHVNAQQANSADTLYRLKTTDTALTSVPLRYQNCRGRSPVLAGVLALWLPTAGQLYNKQYIKFAAIWAVATGSTIGFERTCFNHNLRDNAGADIFLTLILADALYSIIDAPISAVYLNHKYHLGKKPRNFASLHISPDMVSEGAGDKFAPGVSLILIR